MRKKITIAILAVVVVLATLLTGCESGIAQDLYDKATAQVTEWQEKYATAEQAAEAAESAKETLESTVDGLENTINELQQKLEDLELEGATKAATVANIARYYHETHSYSATDMFVCSDMAAEIWNMLETVGINARLAVGNIQTPISDILGSNHAWVLAEVEPGQWLAVETTAGVVYTNGEKPLYYQGWYYDQPVKLKDYNYWIKEYNTRIELHNMLVAADQEAVALYNQNNSPSQLAIHNELNDLIEQMQEEMRALMADINALATRFDL